MPLPALYELARDYRDALDALADTETEEHAMADTLEALRLPVEQKAVNIAHVIKNLEATAAAIKADEERQAARRRACERRAEWLRTYLQYHLEVALLPKLETPQFRFVIRPNPPRTIIDDVTKIPARFMVVPPAPEPVPDKAAIKAALQRDEAVPGAHLEVHTRLEIK